MARAINNPEEWTNRLSEWMRANGGTWSGAASACGWTNITYEYTASNDVDATLWRNDETGELAIMFDAGGEDPDDEIAGFGGGEQVSDYYPRAPVDLDDEGFPC